MEVKELRLENPKQALKEAKYGLQNKITWIQRNLKRNLKFKIKKYSAKFKIKKY